MHEPETHFLTSTPHVPNSALPVLVYRDALPSPYGEVTAREALEKNEWMYGGTFGHYPGHHYHSVTHECYAIVSGATRYLLGKGPLDSSVPGVEFDLKAGDIVVQPAGVAHCNLDSTADFAYIGVYPKGSPHYDNNYCRADTQETMEKASVAHNVPIPDHDPVYGHGGPLVTIWKEAATSPAYPGATPVPS